MAAEAPVTGPVLVFDGKPGCARLAEVMFEDCTCLHWDQLDVSLGTFAGRDVQLWGLDELKTRRVAAELLPLCASVAIVDLSGDPTRPDFSDVLSARGDAGAVIDFMQARLRLIKPPEQAQATPNSPAKRSAPSGHGGAFGMWQSLGLDMNAQGIPYPNIANAKIVLSAHPQIKDRIWFDDFTGKIMQTVDGVDSAWSDAEDLAVCTWLQGGPLLLSKFGLTTVVSAVQAVAFERRRNPLKDWLGALQWDGEPRLGHWVADHLGAAQTAYTEAVGRNWLISMVARAFRPGCQADHMPVLEGKMGRGKSSALAILGGRWYKAAPQAFGSKEFFEAIQGTWLVEIPDMVGFGKREHAQIISAITTRSDAYRAAYARHSIEHPRTCVFAATSEDSDYLQDARGIRRYWPVACGEINLDALVANRDQLFAEAVDSYRNGIGWHDMPVQETVEQQRERVDVDPWLENISEYVATRQSVQVSEISDLVLGLRLQDVGRSEQIRISKCLKQLGYIAKVEWQNNRATRVYRLKK